MAASVAIVPWQPHDGSQPSRNKAPRRRERRKHTVHSFLRHDAEQQFDGFEANGAVNVPIEGGQPRWKERRPTLDVNTPRAVTQASPPTSPFPRSLHSKLRTSSAPPRNLDMLLHTADDTNYTCPEASIPTPPKNTQRDMPFVPPHLRPRTKPVLQVQTTEAAVSKLPIGHDLPTPPSSNQALTSKTEDILRKLEQDFGCKISTPVSKASTPVVSTTRINLSSASSNGQKQVSDTRINDVKGSTERKIPDQANSFDKSPRSAWANPEFNSAEGKKFAKSTSRGRGRDSASPTCHNKAGSRGTKWPTAAEQRPDPNRWKISWDSASEKGCDGCAWSSNDADAGWEGGRKRRVVEDGGQGIQLADWDGNWAPAPVDWDSRPGFRDGQSVERIDKWMEDIVAQLAGVKWGFERDEFDLVGFSAELGECPPLGELAPRYWIPAVIISGMAGSSWKEIVMAGKPAPVDEDDIDRPFWDCYQSQDSALLQPWEPPVIAGIDPDEIESERIARETDGGSFRHTENRKAKEKLQKQAKIEKRRKREEKARKARERAPSIDVPPAFKPAIKLYIRGAKPPDVDALKDIYNHQISFSTTVPEAEPLNTEQMAKKLADIRSKRLPFLVACEPDQKLYRKGPKKYQEPTVVAGKLFGFAFADDFHDMDGLYRFTAKLQIFVDDHVYRKGVGKCLLDKMLGLMDPDDYLEHGGYNVEGNEAEGVGRSRVIKNILAEVAYDDARPEVLEWKKKWLGAARFEEVGRWRKIGFTNGKTVSMAVLQRETGVEVPTFAGWRGG